MTLASTILVAAALAGDLLFVAAYVITAPWWRSEWGRHMTAFGVSLGAILALSLAYRLFGDYPGRQVLLLVAFGALTLLLWQRAVIVIRAQVAPKRVDQSAAPDPPADRRGH